MAHDDRFPHSRAKMLQEEVIALSMCKLSEGEWLKEKPSYSLLVSEWGWNQRTQLHVTLDINMVAGGGALPEKTWKSSLEKRWGWLRGLEPPNEPQKIEHLAQTTQVVYINLRKGEISLFLPSLLMCGPGLCGTFWPWKPCGWQGPATHVDYRKKPEDRQPPA